MLRALTLGFALTLIPSALADEGEAEEVSLSGASSGTENLPRSAADRLRRRPHAGPERPVLRGVGRPASPLELAALAARA